MAMGQPKQRKFGHPGTGRGGRMRPKGRGVDDRAVAEVRALLGDRSRRRDLLIEHLHRIQDRYHHISAAHLAALAEEMRLSMAETFEVATFYAHFDVVKEGEAAPPALTVRVCDSLSCALAGGESLRAELARSLGPDVRVVRAPCMGRCDVAPTAEVGHRHIDHADAAAIRQAIETGTTDPVTPAYTAYDAYAAGGGYGLLRACLDGQRARDDILKVLEDSGLRGLGGAGFPTGRKWRFVLAEPAPRLLAVNGDEGEPGTFKDRWFLETDPHRFLEGMLIAAWVIEAPDTYFYLRDEYPAARHLLAAEIAALHAAGLDRHTVVHLRRGAGAYICGEESAMLESLEGKRGEPRHKPPYPAQVGLFGRPTLINNVETLYWVRDLVEKGPAWFKGQGRNGQTGLRTFSVSGRVKNPGVKVAPAGITARELIDEFCGGMAEGHRFRAYLPGGASGGILPASKADIPLDFGTLEPYGCLIGSAAVVVLSDRDSVPGAARNLLRFFEDESCGQCTPCRVGCAKAVGLMGDGPWDGALLRELGQTMRDASICGLGQAAPNPILSVLDHFAEDVA